MAAANSQAGVKNAPPPTGNGTADSLVSGVTAALATQQRVKRTAQAAFEGMCSIHWTIIMAIKGGFTLVRLNLFPSRASLAVFYNQIASYVREFSIIDVNIGNEYGPDKTLQKSQKLRRLSR